MNYFNKYEGAEWKAKFRLLLPREKSHRRCSYCMRRLIAYIHEEEFGYCKHCLDGIASGKLGFVEKSFITSHGSGWGAGVNSLGIG